MKRWIFILVPVLLGLVALANYGLRRDPMAALPPLIVHEGDNAIVTLVADPTNIGEDPGGPLDRATWKLKLPKSYIAEAQRMTHEESWLDVVDLDFHWPTLEPWKSYLPILEKRQGQERGSPFVDTTRKAFLVRVTLKARVALHPNQLKQNDPHLKFCSLHGSDQYAYQLSVPSNPCPPKGHTGTYYRRIDGRPTLMKFDVRALPGTNLYDQLLIGGDGNVNGWFVDLRIPPERFRTSTKSIHGSLTFSQITPFSRLCSRPPPP